MEKPTTGVKSTVPYYKKGVWGASLLQTPSGVSLQALGVNLTLGGSIR